MTIETKADLVLEGGGVKGAGLAGAVTGLAESGLQTIGRVAGTSAGAIVASLLAAGMSIPDMHTVLREQKFSEFEDGDWLSHTKIGMAVDAVLRGGIFKGDYLHDWIRSHLAALGVRTWGTCSMTIRGAGCRRISGTGLS